MIDAKAVGARLEAIRGILGLSEHELTARLEFPWRDYAHGLRLLPVELAERLLRISGAEVPRVIQGDALTLDWIYLGRTEGMGRELLLDIIANAEDAAADVREEVTRQPCG